MIGPSMSLLTSDQRNFLHLYMDFLSLKFKIKNIHCTWTLKKYENKIKGGYLGGNYPNRCIKRHADLLPYWSC